MNPIDPWHKFLALSLSLSPKSGRETLQLPLPQIWGQGVGEWGQIYRHARGLIFMGESSNYVFKAITGRFSSISDPSQ